MALRQVTTLPAGEDWMYEIKHDGFRVLAVKDGQTVRLWSRNEKDLTSYFPVIVESVRALNTTSAVIDGEAAVFGPDGRTCFDLLQLNRPTAALVAFDLLHVDAQDLHRQPLAGRRSRLEQLLPGSGVMFSHEVVGDPEAICQKARAMKLEGIIAKRRDSVYRAGAACRDWLKVKFRSAQEFVVGGYLPPVEAPGALLVGYYEGDKFRFAGRVASGLGIELRRQLVEALRLVDADGCPFHRFYARKQSRFDESVTAAELPSVRWVKPLIVIQAEFLNWTSTGLLRQPSFKGLRIDKDPRDVSRAA